MLEIWWRTYLDIVRHAVDNHLRLFTHLYNRLKIATIGHYNTQFLQISVELKFSESDSDFVHEMRNELVRWLSDLLILPSLYQQYPIPQFVAVPFEKGIHIFADPNDCG